MALEELMTYDSILSNYHAGKYFWNLLHLFVVTGRPGMTYLRLWKVNLRTEGLI